jgi:dipeptidyl aminopeptidase/acylaminoacyl peptidase
VALIQIIALIGTGVFILLVGVSLLGRILQSPLLAYVDFDFNTNIRDLVILDFEHQLRISKPLQVDVGDLDWTQQRLIVMSYGIGGQWQSYPSLSAEPLIETRGDHEFTWLWSPDERYLAHSGWEEESDTNYLYIEDTQTGEIERIFHPESSSHQPLKWSDDGTGLIYQRQPLVGSGSLYYYIPATGAQRLIAEAAGDPVWSPDGRQIVYTAYVDSSLRPRLEVYDLNTDESQVLLPEDLHDQHTAAWSPDGEWIALAYDDALAVVRPDGSDLQVLTTPFFASNPLWSPDGRSIVFIAGAGLTSLYKIADVQGAIRHVQQTGLPLDPLLLTLDRQIYGVYPVWQPD